MWEKISEWALREVTEMRRAPTAVAVLVVIGFIGGWAAGKAFYAERIEILNAQLKGPLGSPAGAAVVPESGPKVRGTLVKGFGREGRICGEIFDGDAVMDFRDNYTIGFVCGFVDSTVDKFEDTRITVSEGHTIVHGDIYAVAPYSREMNAVSDAVLAEAKKANPNANVIKISTQTWYEPILIPRGLDVSTIRKLSDVPKYGGKIVTQLGANDH